MNIEYGCSRTVFLIGNYAFKFPTVVYKWRNFLNGLLHNMQEKAFSDMGHEYLCPVYFSLWGGFLNIMPRCEVLSAHEHLNSGTRIIIRQSIGLEIEDKHTSFGWLNGRIVAIDYGD